MSRPGQRVHVWPRRPEADRVTVFCEACQRRFVFRRLSDALLASEAHKRLERRRYQRKMRELRRRWPVI